MINYFYLIIICLCFSCQPIQNEKDSCLNNCLSFKAVNFFFRLDSILVKSKSHNDTVFFDSLNCQLFMSANDKVFLIDCLKDTFYIQKIKQYRYKNRKVDWFHENNYCIYQTNREFYIFDDDDFSIKYSSWDFLKSISDSLLIGLSGVNISFKKINNKIIISYELLTDIDPFVIDTIYDEFRLNRDISY